MRLTSLHVHTNKLPKINFQHIDNFIGKTTNESMLIGVYDSLLFEVKNVIEKYKSRYPNIRTIITGGDLKIIKNKIKNINFINPYLLMEGLNYIIACNEEI
jgi:type III pantothenate kinase